VLFRNASADAAQSLRCSQVKQLEDPPRSREPGETKSSAKDREERTRMLPTTPGALWVAEALTHPRYWYTPTLQEGAPSKISPRGTAAECCCTRQLAPHHMRLTVWPPAGAMQSIQHQVTPTHQQDCCPEGTGQEDLKAHQAAAVTEHYMLGRQDHNPPSTVGHKARSQMCIAAHAHLQTPCQGLLAGGKAQSHAHTHRAGPCPHI
jgi:hypothetical protein